MNQNDKQTEKSDHLTKLVNSIIKALLIIIPIITIGALSLYSIFKVGGTNNHILSIFAKQTFVYIKTLCYLLVYVTIFGFAYRIIRKIIHA